MRPWILKQTSEEITDINQIDPKAIGFIYLVNIDGLKYIGKKSLYSERKKNLGKKELAEITDKRLKTYKKVIKESDWKKYYGSNAKIKELVSNGSVPERIILEFAYSKQHLTYLETKYQFTLGVLEDTNFLNDNILGKFYRKLFNFSC